MKVSLVLLPALVGAALAVQNSTAVNGTLPQPDLSALADTFETLTDSFLAKALKRLDDGTPATFESSAREPRMALNTIRTHHYCKPTAISLSPFRPKH